MREMKQKLALFGGLGAILLVLLPPVSTAADSLFAMHMAQHLVLIVITAPLLIVSGIFAGIENYWLIRKLTDPVIAWTGFVGIFLFWHWPTAFQWAAQRESTQLLEHFTILFGALLFWAVALSTKSQQWLGYGTRALFVMTAAVITDLPGVIMVFSPHAICSMPAENAAQWGLTPIEDQQLAGMLMWVPANLVFFAIAVWLFARWIASSTLSHSSRHYREIT